MRHSIMHLHDQLSETAVHTIAHRFHRMDIGNWAAADRLAGLGIVVGRARRLHNKSPEPAVRPSGGAEGMYVPEHGTHISIHPEPLTDELHSHDVAIRMVMLERILKRDRVAGNRSDALDLIALHIIRAHQQLRLHVILSRVLDRNALAPLLRSEE